MAAQPAPLVGLRSKAGAPPAGLEGWCRLNLAGWGPPGAPLHTLVAACAPADPLLRLAGASQQLGGSPLGLVKAGEWGGRGLGGLCSLQLGRSPQHHGG